MKTSILHTDPILRVASADDVLFAVWSDAPEIDQIRALERAGDQHRDALHGRKHALVNVVRDGTPRFSDDVRAESMRLTRRSVGWRSATAHVILVSGLAGVAVRSFMSTVLLLGRTPVPTKVFDSTEAAARWLLPHLGDAWTEPRLGEAFGWALRAPGEALPRGP